MPRHPSASVETIIEAAREICREAGIGGLTITSVARRCGIAEATVYNYVANKAELLRLSAAEDNETPREYYERLCAGPKPVGSEWLVEAIQRHLRFLRSFLPTVLLRWATPDLERPSGKGFQASLQALMALFDHAEIPWPDRDTAARVFMSACLSRAFSESMFGRETSADADLSFAERLAAFLLGDPSLLEKLSTPEVSP